MIGLARPKLTGWLILLMVLSFFQFSSGLRTLPKIQESYKPAYDRYPSLAAAVLIAQVLAAGGMIVSAWTMIVIYKREAKSLILLKSVLVAGGLLNVAVALPIPLFSGFPPEVSRELLRGAFPAVLASIVLTFVWFLYVDRSKIVREIYGQASADYARELAAEIS